MDSPSVPNPKPEQLRLAALGELGVDAATAAEALAAACAARATSSESARSLALQPNSTRANNTAHASSGVVPSSTYNDRSASPIVSAVVFFDETIAR